MTYALVVAAWTLWALLSLYALWIFFAAVMCLKTVRDKGLMNTQIKVLGVPVLFVGYVLDAVLNVLVMTVICLELPRETTISARLKRYNRDPRTWWWRRKVAAVFEPILDPLDPSGDHI